MVTGDVQRLRQQVATVWTRYRTTMIVVALVLLGAGLRFYRPSANGFSTDEIWTIWIARFDVFQIVRLAFETNDGTPPAFYVLLHPLLLIGQHPLVVRVLSIFAGTLTVWLTFRLAVSLFDLRVATLSAFLMAVAPLHIGYSRVARAYMLGSLCALFSLYFFAQLLFQEDRRRDWIGLVVATAVGIWSFYLVFLLVLFENTCIAFLWLRRRLSWSMLVRWSISQVGLGILVLPALLYVVLKALGGAGVWERQSWLPRPGLQSLGKSAILFSTGDPSYGPTGMTLARLFSLMTIVGLGVLGLWVFLQRGYHRRLDDEGRRVLFLAGVLMVPWATAFTIAQVRPIYREKYFLFLMPPLFILFAWVFTRARHVITSSLVLLALISLTGSALFVYYTEPSGEQWREVIAYIRRAYQSDDLVVISPGFYCRPFAYYFYGDFPEDTDTLERAPAIVVENGEFRVFSLSHEAEGIRATDPALASAQRLWFLSGYTPADPLVTTWIEQDFKSVDSGEFVGARVRLLQRTQGQETQATTLQE